MTTNNTDGAEVQQRATSPGYDDFTANVEAALRTRFAGFGHSPSPEHWDGLRAIIETIKAMALGVAPPKYHLSSLPTGMGKTSVLIEATRELIRIGEETGEPVGILILTNTLDQIPVLIAEIGLKEHQYAVRTGSKNIELNARGVGEDTLPGEARHANAQVLFTTQQKLHALTSLGLHFANMYTFTFRSRPRAVRVWDEAILPALPYVLSADDIDRLKSPLLKAGFKAQRDALEVLTTTMKARGHDDSINVPELDLPDPETHPGLFDERDLWVVDVLGRMTEGHALIRQDSYAGIVALYYEEILPRGFAPLLVLDASGSLRLTYAMWKAGRRNLVELPSAGKTYRNLTIRHWDQRAGKAAHNYTAPRRRLAQGVADAVAAADPNEPILVIIRKHGGKPSRVRSQNMEAEIREAVRRRLALEDHDAPELSFLTWGRHLATNAYGDIKHVIVVGLLAYSTAQAEAMARGSGGLADSEELSDAAIDTFHKGEIAHHLFQAVGRGAVRKAIAGDVPVGCKLDVIFSTRGNGASVPVNRSILRNAFPGAKIVDWQPAVSSSLKPNEARLVAELNRIASSSETGGFFKQKELEEAVGLSQSNIYLRMSEPRVKAELARIGIAIERPPRGSHRPTHVYYSGPYLRSTESADELKAAKTVLARRRERRAERREARRSSIDRRRAA